MLDDGPSCRYRRCARGQCECFASSGQSEVDTARTAEARRLSVAVHSNSCRDDGRCRRIGERQSSLLRNHDLITRSNERSFLMEEYAVSGTVTKISNCRHAGGRAGFPCSGPREKAVKIGLLLNLSGPAAAFGIPERDALFRFSSKISTRTVVSTARRSSLRSMMTRPTRRKPRVAPQS